jgi:hypothetical protein
MPANRVGRDDDWLMVDAFFSKRGAGAVLSIKIAGTREKPQFGLDLH